MSRNICFKRLRYWPAVKRPKNIHGKSIRGWFAAFVAGPVSNPVTAPIVCPDAFRRFLGGQGQRRDGAILRAKRLVPH